ncbi:putative beta-glucosidase G [Paramyrothecium foliicola]|nr:putative beta-glucosidase G [Paramyrothecium foliicola]
MSSELVVDMISDLDPRPDESKGKGAGGWRDLWAQVASLSVKVKNTGKAAGNTVPQLYVSFPQNTTPAGTPVRVLRGFDKVYLEPGETRDVMLSLKRRDLSYWNEEIESWVIPEGFFFICQRLQLP